MMRLLTCLGLSLVLIAPAFGLTADEQLRFADGIYLRGLYESAVGEYLLLLRDFPGSGHEPAVLYRTGECYRQMGNQAGAERFYKRVEEEHPESPQALRALLRRAEFALADGREELARDELQRLVESRPPPDVAAAAWYYLGLSHGKKGDRAAAEKAFEEVLQSHRDSPHASYAALELAGLYSGRRRPDARMTKWFEQAVESAATPSARAEALYRWGDWAFRQGRYQLAADLLQSLLVELPDEPRARDARLASAWSLYYLDRIDEALAAAAGLLDSAQDAETEASAIYLRANALRKLDRDLDALLDYETVVRRYPGTTFANRAAYEIMVTHFKRGDSAKTLAAAPVRPEDGQEADVLWMRAESQRLLGRTDAARGRYQELVENYPQSDQAAPALLRLGELAREANRLAEAADLFRRMAHDYPKNEAVAEALQASAVARFRAGDAEGALADWDELLELKAEEAVLAEARLQKALVLIELKRSKEAMGLLETVLENGAEADQIARAHYWRGVLLSGQEKWKAAEEALRASLASAPDAQTEALARLRLVVVLQRQDRMDEAADQVEPLLGDAARVADNPALVEWVVRRRFEQEQDEPALRAALALARHTREAAWRQIGWYWAGVSQTRLGDEAAARAAYEAAVAEPASTREGAEAQLLLAGLELKAGRHDQAAERYAAAAETARGEDSLDLRVRAYFGLGETAEAAKEPERAARHFMSVAVLFDDPEWSPHALFRAGRLFGEAGNTAAQTQAWGELKQRYPNSGFARQLEGLLP